MRELFNLIFNQKDIDWLKKLFGIKPKPEPIQIDINKYAGMFRQEYEPVMIKVSRRRQDLIEYIVHQKPDLIEAELKKEIMIDIIGQLYNDQSLVNFSYNGETLQATLIIQKPKNERPIETYATSSYHFNSSN
jgi:hypothetical protein